MNALASRPSAEPWPVPAMDRSADTPAYAVGGLAGLWDDGLDPSDRGEAGRDGTDGLVEAGGDSEPAADDDGTPPPTIGLAAQPDEAQLAAWIARIAERDEQALSALYDATFARVHGLVLRIVRRPAWAEEVLEDTYFQVWRQALRFDAGRGRALTWLLGMARSRAIDALRREAHHDHRSLDADDAPALPDPTLPGADEWLDCVRGHARLHRALLGLGATPRQLLALAFFRGLSHEEIAEQTALPLGTVKSQIRRSLQALRAVLGDSVLSALPT
jgi:RNA polymerase sigma-70 factor (ECF subfamily)